MLNVFIQAKTIKFMSHEIRVLEYLMHEKSKIEDMSKNMRIPEVILKNVLRTLEEKKLIKAEGDVFSITEEGKKYLIELKKL